MSRCIGLPPNGYYDFGRAFRSNDLDFRKFYRTIPDQVAITEMREEFEEAVSTSKFTDNPAHPLERIIKADARRQGAMYLLMS